MSFPEGPPRPDKHFPDESEIDHMVEEFSQSGTIFVDDGLAEAEHQRDIDLHTHPIPLISFALNNQMMLGPRIERPGYPKPERVTGLDIVSQLQTNLTAELMSANTASVEAYGDGDLLATATIDARTEKIRIIQSTLYYSYKHLRRNSP